MVPRTSRALLVLAAAFLALGPGCAQLKKNMKNPHPEEHQFGHVLFNESTIGRFPKLQPAAPKKADTPKERKDKQTELAKAPSRAPVAEVPQAPAAPRRPDVTEPSTVAKAPTQPKGEAGLPTVPAPPEGPKPTRDTGLDITEVPGPEAKSPEPARGGLGDGSMAGEMLAAAQRLLGIRDNFDEQGLLTHLLQSADYKLTARSGQDLVKAFYEDLASKKAVFGPTHQPEPGDVVFFHNTHDRDGDSRSDDWFTMAGVVESVDGSGTVTLIGFARGEIQRLYMNLDRPSVRRNEATDKNLNSLIRAKQLSDRPFTAYLAGELFASYGRIGGVAKAEKAASVDEVQPAPEAQPAHEPVEEPFEEPPFPETPEIPADERQPI